MLSENLLTLRKIKKLSQEQMAEAIGVSRQTVAKWESGETVPDINNCAAIAEYFEVTLDDLINFSRGENDGLPIPPRGKFFFGVVDVGPQGQIVLPERARKVFHIQEGEKVMVLGDELQGIALMPEKRMQTFMNEMQNHLKC